MLMENDIIIYEVYEKLTPRVPGELIQGISIVHPGKIGKEFFMTKGHFHSTINTAELYFCLKGNGYMMMEDIEGTCIIKEFTPNTAVYIPGGWAHRSININNDEDLITIFVYPANAGHDYATIESKGFRKLVIQENGNPKIIDNPKWLV